MDAGLRLKIKLLRFLQHFLHISPLLSSIYQNSTLGKLLGLVLQRGMRCSSASLLTPSPHGIDDSYSSSYLSQIISPLHLPHGQTLQLPLSQSYSIARNSLQKPIFVASLHYDFVLPLSSFNTVREYSAHDALSSDALAELFFNKHRI